MSAHIEICIDFFANREFGAVQKLESIVGAVEEWANIVDIKNTRLK